MIATEGDFAIQFSLEILQCTKSEVRIILENSYRKIHKNHREIRQQTVESFYLWLHSKSIRGNFALMIFTKKRNCILCEREILKIDYSQLI